MLSLHTPKVFENKQHNLYSMLQARNRHVRLFALNWLKAPASDLYFSGKNAKVIQLLWEIDSEHIDLESER